MDHVDHRISRRVLIGRFEKAFAKQKSEFFDSFDLRLERSDSKVISEGLKCFVDPAVLFADFGQGVKLLLEWFLVEFGKAFDAFLDGTKV